MCVCYTVSSAKPSVTLYVELGKPVEMDNDKFLR